MKFTLSWLKEYTSVEYTPAEVADKLTMAGLEVESYSNRFDYLDKIVVSRVESVEKHPGADSLTCCKVNVGKDNTGNDIILNIVCGAKNVRKGLAVPCALIGAVLPGGFEIKKSRLRGEISEGMLCSASELKLDLSSSGIMELESNLITGTPVAEALSLNDYLFEVNITPNRPDCLSVIGIAREAAAFSDPAAKLNLPLNLDDDNLTKEKEDNQEICCNPAVENNGQTLINKSIPSIHDFASVEIFDPDLCPRYTASMVVDVKVAPSPFWLQDRLLSVGLTPINNIVDVTNFVMMETGQPLHAFDYDNIAKSRIEVKRAGDNIQFKTLDSKTHTLEPDMLMICDGERPVGIAGVMGGENSEILETTTKVFVESAYFNPISIRRTAKRSGINSDASHRFERGIDPCGAANALKRAVSLMAQISGGKILNDLIDINPIKHTPVEIYLNIDTLNKRVGTNLTYNQIKRLLESIQFKVFDIKNDTLNGINQSNNNISAAEAVVQDQAQQAQSNIMKVIVPSFRVDVTRPEDLSEEVARLWGYNKIETSFPKVPAKGSPLSAKIIRREQIRDIMTGFGFSEAINYSFTSASACSSLCLSDSDERRSVEDIINPISEELSVLRTTLLPSLLENIRRNNSQQIDSLRLFETGNIFLATSKGSQPVEKEMTAGVWTGFRSTISWYEKPLLCDFFDIKGVAQGLCNALEIENIKFEKPDPLKFPYYKKGEGAVITAAIDPESIIITTADSSSFSSAANLNKTNNSDNIKIIGSLGKINNHVLKNFGIKQDVFAFEIDMEALISLAPHPYAMKTNMPLPKYPSVSRDLTLILDSNIKADDIISDIKALKKNISILEDTFLFDLYEGKPLADGKKSISIRIVYRSSEKTLTEKMISKIHGDISNTIIKQYKADLP